jgi:hypothetical protein
MTLVDMARKQGFVVMLEGNAQLPFQLQMHPGIIRCRWGTGKVPCGLTTTTIERCYAE